MTPGTKGLGCCQFRDTAGAGAGHFAWWGTCAAMPTSKGLADLKVRDITVATAGAASALRALAEPA